MFENWKEFIELFGKEVDHTHNCESCGQEDFDLMTTEEESNNEWIAVFICKNCGIQKNMQYKKLEKTKDL